MTDEIIRRDTASGAAANGAGAPPASAPTATTAGSVAGIAGISVLKGVILYAAVASFAGLYLHVITKILAAHAGHPPSLDGTLLGAAAALAGVLGSAFAFEMGTPVDPGQVNRGLQQALAGARSAGDHVVARLRQVLSLDPGGTDQPSWPRTFGIWAYAAIAGAVAITYVTHQSETPNSVKPIALAFAGYVLVLIKSAYSGASTTAPATEAPESQAPEVAAPVAGAPSS